jgi:protein-S-isoprenylcysteine O-methyltransferase Ste14
MTPISSRKRQQIRLGTLQECLALAFSATICRYRDKIAIAFFLGILACLARGGKTLGLGEPAESWFDAFGCLIAALGHVLRVMALRHIGPRSRTHRLGARQLVQGGPYAVVRNPLYLGNWLIAVGLCVVAQLRWLLLAGPLVAFLLYYVVSLAEEQRLLEQFGDDYRRYCETTPRFFPRRLFTRRGWRDLLDARGPHAVFRTKEYWAFLSTATCVILIELIDALSRAGGSQ